MSSKGTIKNTLWKILLGICVAVFAAAAVLLVLHLWPIGRPPVGGVSSAPVSFEGEELPDNPIDFAALQAQYKDAKGWIRIPGTTVDYAVMQTPEGENDSYYLDKAEDGTKRRSGSIYIESINSGDFTDPNTLIYGHNMRNSGMFGALHKFKKKDFFQQNQYIYIYTPGHILTYRIFSVHIFDDRHILYAFDFDSPEGYGEFLEYSLNPTSMTRQVRKDVAVTTDDRIITLSTCTNRDSERLLVEGVLIHDQPTN